MIAINFSIVYERLKEAGLVRSKREFSRNFLAKRSGYVADVLHRDVLGARGGLPIMRDLRDRLTEIAAEVPDSLRCEIVEIIAGIDAGVRVVEVMARGR
ncbi:hypothetical protein [Microvirga soli]|uniref:hypothetical protein n=1 Tax=Microvirga soli TaxID=1854496 RepID=UPI00191CD89B|nr:hypothetical protein [Microvirga soli]